MNEPAQPAATPRPIVDVGWLQARRDDGVVVVDVRWYLDGRSGQDAYRSGHIPGAVWLDLSTVLAGPPSPAEGRHPLPSEATFANGLAALGIGADTTVVAYDDLGGMAAGRLVWLLRILGRPAALLSGGLPAWPDPLATGDESLSPVPAVPFVWPVERFALADEVAEAAATGVVLDARAGERFRGEVEPIDPRAGHIPGARNAPFVDNLASPGGAFLDGAALKARFTELGIAQDSEIVAYCGSGVSACVTLLALEEAGFAPHLARLYPGSWSQWAADETRPAATGPV